MSTNGLLGVEELQQALRQLPEELQRKILVDWAARNARQVATAAASQAPRGKTGNLRKGIKARRTSKGVLQKLKSLARSVVIGAAPAYHFHWVNHGTTQRSHDSTGRNTGRMPANPFLERAARPILERAHGDIRGDLSRSVQRTLDAAVKRTLRHVR